MRVCEELGNEGRHTEWTRSLEGTVSRYKPLATIVLGVLAVLGVVVVNGGYATVPQLLC